MGYKQTIGLDGTPPRILLYDLETAPLLGYAWETREANILHVVEHGYLLCYAYKWLGDKTIRWVKADPPDDRAIVDKLWRLFNRADWIIAHNGIAFDQKTANSRFLHYDLPPPQSYQEIDTLRWSRRTFREPSHALDAVTQKYLGAGKEPHHGFKTWLDCMANKRAGWSEMKRYNIRDVQILEDWYLRIRPWIGRPGTLAPNMSHWSNGERICSGCGNAELVAIGTFRRTHEYQEWRCTNCQKPNRARLRRLEAKGREPRLV